MKIVKWIGIIIGSLLLIAATFTFQPWVFLPHNHIEIGLPILPADDADSYLIPMGEKIYHNESNGNPNGHPGLDIGGWNRKVAIVAVADGWVFRAQKIKAGTTTLEIYSGMYKNIYQELNEVDPNLRTFSRVKKGQILGYTGVTRDLTKNEPPPEFPSGQLHWDFASASHSIDRLCPLGYLDADSRKRLEDIWARMPMEQFKGKYPDICSGFYNGRED